MDVLVVEPGYAPYEKSINGLDEMQATVGGLIQAIYPYEEQVAIVCNEEGLLHSTSIIAIKFFAVISTGQQKNSFSKLFMNMQI